MIVTFGVLTPPCAGAGQVSITLEDGSTETGDLLIGADGIWSKVRRQMMGDSSPCYSGYTCYTGKGSVWYLGMVVLMYGSRVTEFADLVDAADADAQTGLVAASQACALAANMLLQQRQWLICCLLCLAGISDFTPPDLEIVGYRVFLGNGQVRPAGVLRG